MDDQADRRSDFGQTTSHLAGLSAFRYCHAICEDEDEDEEGEGVLMDIVRHWVKLNGSTFDWGTFYIRLILEQITVPIGILYLSAASLENKSYN